MIYISGDSHGDFTSLYNCQTLFSPTDILIHVGDFGFSKESILAWNKLFPNGYPCSVYVIDGNHEDFNFLGTYSTNTITEIVHNLFYVPRGTVIELHNKVFAFLGGGDSINKAQLVENISWWPQERITDADVSRLYSNIGTRHVDYLITHVCSQSFFTTHFGVLDYAQWQLPDDWVDISMQQIQRVVDTVSPGMHIFGHMHTSIHTLTSRCFNIHEIDCILPGVL
jgi:hypothetical protein